MPNDDASPAVFGASLSARFKKIRSALWGENVGSEVVREASSPMFVVLFGAAPPQTSTNCGCPFAVGATKDLEGRFQLTEAVRSTVGGAVVVNVFFGCPWVFESPSSGSRTFRPAGGASLVQTLPGSAALGGATCSLGCSDLFPAASTSLEAKRSWNAFSSPLRVVSANLRPRRFGVVSPAPYVVETLVGLALPRPIRLGVVGLTSPCGGRRDNTARFDVADPYPTLERLMPELRRRADFVVVLLEGSEFQLRRVASAPGIDLVLALTLGRRPSHRFETIGRAIVMRAPAASSVVGLAGLRIVGGGHLHTTGFHLVNLNNFVP